MGPMREAPPTRRIRAAAGGAAARHVSAHNSAGKSACQTTEAPIPESIRDLLGATEELAGDDLALDLGGALVDARRADLAVEVLEDVALLEGARAVDLDRHVDRPLRGLGGEQLRHRGGLGGRP